MPLDLAAHYAKVSKDTIRYWVHKGLINRYDDGYDLTELDNWISQRSDWAIFVRAGLEIEHWPTDGPKLDYGRRHQRGDK